jgi:hypothetical protein
MTKKTGKIGHQTGGSSDSWMAPSKPYTGDGKKKRSFVDGIIQVVFKKATDK